MKKKTVSEIYREWRNVKRHLVKESSFATYSINIERHILPAFGNCRTVDNDDAQALAFRLAADGLSANTVKGVMLVLRMLLEFGWRHGWAERPDLRIGELCGLKWSDIDLRARLLYVRRTVARVYTETDGRWGTKVVVGPPKTPNSLREIPLSPELAAMLRPLARLAEPSAYVLTVRAKPLEPRCCRHHYKRLMQSLGLSCTKFHALRHTFATRCIETNCDCKTVSSILGHANINTTLNLYVHPDMGLKRKCIDRMLRSLK